MSKILAKKCNLERRFLDLRFKNSEEAIIKSFFEIKKSSPLSVRKIIRKAGIGRATFYIHHKAITQILPDYEIYLLKKYTHLARKMIRQGLSLKAIYFKTSIFILTNKKHFMILIRGKRRKIFIEMIKILRTPVTKHARLLDQRNKIFDIYTYEVTEILMEWGKAKFNEESLDNVLSDIMYLTSTIRLRLEPLYYNRNGYSKKQNKVAKKTTREAS